MPPVERLENGYKFLVRGKGTYGELLNFFKGGGMGVYDEDHRDNFLAINPTEQFLIQTGKRLFRGMDDYEEVHRLSFRFGNSRFGSKTIIEYFK